MTHAENTGNVTIGKSLIAMEVGSLSELTQSDLQQVQGGLLPALGFAGALAGHVGLFSASGGTISMAAGVAGHIVSGFGLGYAAYSLGTAYGGGKNRDSAVNPH
jgi:hypothetical protein